MTQLSIQQMFEIAQRHLAASQHREAEGMFRQILAHDPRHLDSMLMLGFMLSQQQRLDEAEQWLSKAKSLAPQAASVYANLAILRIMQRRLDDALEAIETAVKIRPNSRDIQSTRGNVLQASGKLDQAIEAYRTSVKIDPNFAAGWNNLGAAQSTAGNVKEAISAFERSASINPREAGTFFNLGRALGELGENTRAIAALDRALTLNPAYAEALNQRGVLFQTIGRIDEAIADYRKAAAVKPDFADVYNNLGVALQSKRDFDAAIEAYQRAISIRPGYADVYGNLAQALSQIGELDQSLETYRSAQKLAADRRSASGMMLFLHTHPDFDAPAILREHKWWEEAYPKPLYSQITPHTNDRDPDRRLRIAYLSADLNEHPAGRFMLPVLQNHDRKNLEIICYYDIGESDAMTQRLRQYADEWHHTWRLNDAQLAAKIREDKIDIVVDLLMHAKGNRMLALARKPAPVQISYLAYCSTTGLPTIDYRISDPYLDPPGFDESVYTEKTARVSASYWCYSVPTASPEVESPPSEAKGFVTFGCMNNFWKVSRVAIGMWSDLLSCVPDSRLVVHTHEGKHRQRFIDRLGGIDPSRVEFVGFQPAADYFRTFGRIDISLDPFPYGGGTTTCDSLWMGVPVISRMGQTAVSRGGSSILSNLDLKELLATNHDEYVRIARSLASDAARLRELRLTLRDRMKKSPLMDGQRLANDLQKIYRAAWRTWCGGELR